MQIDHSSFTLTSSLAEYVPEQKVARLAFFSGSTRSGNLILKKGSRILKERSVHLQKGKNEIPFSVGDIDSGKYEACLLTDTQIQTVRLEIS